MIAIGIGPVTFQLLAGKMLPPTYFSPDGLTAEDEGRWSREATQFIYFWYLVSFFLVGIGAWFTIAGLKSKAIVSKTKPN